MGSYKKSWRGILLFVCLLFSPRKQGSRLLIAWKLYSIWRFLFWAAVPRDCGFSELIPELCCGVDSVSLQAFSPCHQPLPALHFSSTYSCPGAVAIFPLNMLIFLLVIKDIVKHNRKSLTWNVQEPYLFQFSDITQS